MSKGVIVDIRDDEDMPYTVDEFGNKIVADIVMEPASVVSRLNPGRIFEQFFCDASRRTQTLIRNTLGGKSESQSSDAEIDAAFDLLLGFIKIIGTAQYDAYLSVKGDMCKKREIIRECVEEEVFIHYRVSSEKLPYQIYLDLQNTIYFPKLLPAFIKKDGVITQFKTPMRIAPVYEIVLNKTADLFLAVAGAKVNHYGIPINAGTSGKDRMPSKSNSVKSISETESRLYNAYGGKKVLAELKDRANSISTHKHIYKNILDADMPTNMNNVVNRQQQPFGDDAGLQLVNNIMNSAGISIDYTPIEKK